MACSDQSTEGLLGRILERLASVLAKNIHRDLGLWDPDLGRATPDDHYGQLAAALALRLLDRASGVWQEPIKVWETLPRKRRGHFPFNRFLLLALREAARNEAIVSPGGAEIDRALSHCALERAYPSNNWVLLAQLCRLLEQDSPRARQAENHSLMGILDGWMSPGGGFVDFPARPDPHVRGATPIAYHHKALLVAVLAAWHSGDVIGWAPRIAKLLQWSELAWDGDRHVGGFGRSTHSLFGDACLVASLYLLGAADDKASDTTAGKMLRGVLNRWSTQFRGDGFLGLNPASARPSRSGCDDYMHVSVYNAWAAAVVAWARDLRSKNGAPPLLYEIDRRRHLPNVLHDAFSGLLRVSCGQSHVDLVSTVGQTPQSFSRSFVEFRYAGGIPFHIARGASVLCPPPVRVHADLLRQSPALAGWTPVFEVDGEIFGLTVFDTESLTQSENCTKIVLQGRPIALLRRPRTDLIGRLSSALDWRFFGGALGRREALKHRYAEGIHIVVSLILDAIDPAISQHLTITNRRKSAVTFLNPCGHATVHGTPFQRILRSPGSAAGALKNRAPRDLSEADLDSSLAGATGWCLPSEQVAIGEARYECTVHWQ